MSKWCLCHIRRVNIITIITRFGGLYIDKISSGFILWEPSLKAYCEVDATSPLSASWEADSRPALAAINNVLADGAYFTSLLSLFAQESDTRLDRGTDLNLRSDNVMFISSIGEQPLHFSCSLRHS